MVADGRWIALEGAANVRDLGGLPLAGGGSTAHGVVVRSDNLQGLTGEDVEQLVGALGVRRVVDLRTEAEIELEGPGPLVADGRVEILHRSLHPETGGRTDVDVETVVPWQAQPFDGDPDETPAVRAYLGYLRHRPDSVVGALRDVANGSGAAIVHCAAGKDRTGVVCALALEAVGVARAAVVADYVATGERIEPLFARLKASPTYAAELAGHAAAAHTPRAATMERVLAVLDERDGGPVGWLRDAGLRDDELAALRHRLVA